MAVNVEEAMLDPSAAFTTPGEILTCRELTAEQKIEVLRRWAYDIRELRVAEGEGMQGRALVTLDEVLDALHALGAPIDLEHGPPTRHGGF